MAQWTLVGALVALVVLAVAEAPFAYHRFYVYPRVEGALAEIDGTRQRIERRDGLHDIRAVLHSHSHLSHDSMGTVEEIAAAARRAGVRAIFMTDHFGWLVDNPVITQGVRGEYGGVFFVVGAEMRDGVMPFFLNQPLSRYNPHQPLQDYVNDLRAMGAMVFLNHPDDPERRWDLKNWAGMEIYNLHADARKARLSMFYRLSEQFWSMERHPMRVFHRLAREPKEYLALWDRFTRHRRVVGIAGNDAHQNNGMRLLAQADGAVALTDTSGAQRAPWLIGADVASRTLARAAFGELTPGRTLWRMDADLYERSFRFVTTHLLVKRVDEAALREALENGHAYVAFDSLVAADGFDFVLRGQPAAPGAASGNSAAPGGGALQPGEVRAIMGDEVRFEPGLELEARSPVPARLRLVQDGRVVREEEGRSLHMTVAAPGVYRVEAHLSATGESKPWVYTNPIYIR